MGFNPRCWQLEIFPMVSLPLAASERAALITTKLMSHSTAIDNASPCFKRPQLERGGSASQDGKAIYGSCVLLSTSEALMRIQAQRLSYYMNSVLFLCYNIV